MQHPATWLHDVATCTEWAGQQNIWMLVCTRPLELAHMPFVQVLLERGQTSTISCNIPNVAQKMWLFSSLSQHYPTCTLLAEPFLAVHMLCTEKWLCTNPVKFLLSMLSALLSNSFEPSLNRCSFLTVSFGWTFRRHFYLLPAGSVSIIGFSQKLMLALEKPVWRE